MTMVNPGVSTEVFADVEQNRGIKAELEAAAIEEDIRLHMDICRGLGRVLADGSVVVGFEIVHFRQDVLNGLAIAEGTKAVITAANEQQAGQFTRKVILDEHAQRTMTHGSEEDVAKSMLARISELDAVSKKALFPGVWRTDFGEDNKTASPNIK